MEKVKEKIKSIILNQNLLFRFIVFILSTFLFSVLPYIIFILYMHEKNFFSYDFFNNGLFGMKVFYIFLVISLFILGMFLFLWAFFLPKLIFYLIKIIVNKIKILKNKNTKSDIAKINNTSDKKNSIVVLDLLYSIISIIILVSLFFNKNFQIYKDYIYFLAFIFIPLFFHYGTLLYCECKKYFSILTFLIFVVCLFLGLFKYQKQLLSSLDFVLNRFNIGGDKKLVNIKKNNHIYKGKLLLITPNYIYFKSNTKLFIIDRNTVVDINITKNIAKKNLEKNNKDKRNKK